MIFAVAGDILYFREDGGFEVLNHPEGEQVPGG
jgi:hypothetical protein